MGILVSRMTRSGEMPWYYLFSLLQLQCKSFLRPGCEQRTRDYGDMTNSVKSETTRIVTAESVGTQTSEARCKHNTLEKDEPITRIENTHGSFNNCQSFSNSAVSQGHGFSYNTCRDCVDVVSENVHLKSFDIFQDFDVSSHDLEYESQVVFQDQLSGPELDYRCRRFSSLSPVKEETDSDTSTEVKSARVLELNDTYPVFEDSDAETSTHIPSLASLSTKCRGRSFRRKLYGSVSSDSGIGEVLHTSSHASSSSGCVSTSDSSDCNSSTHSCDLSNTSHTDDLEHCEEDFFNHDTPTLQTENGTDGKDNAFQQPELNLNDNIQINITSPKAQRPALAPLNFRARRKVTFSEDVSSDDGPVDNSPSCQERLTSHSGFTRNCRPFFSRQDSDDSMSSTSSGDSILAVPLSPNSSASSENSFTFTDSDPASNANCFSERREGCDLVLVAEGERFHVHSSVVAWQCSALLQHVRQTGSTEVVLLDKRAADVLCFLGLLYPFHRQAITEQNVEGLVELSNYLGCERVLRMCTSYLTSLAQFSHLCPHKHLQRPQRQNPSSPLHLIGAAGRGVKGDSSSLCGCAGTMVDRVLATLVLSARYQLDDVYHSYLHLTATLTTASLAACPRFTHLSALIRQDILMSRLTKLESVVSSISLKESDLVSCKLHRHDKARTTYTGPLCLRCSSKNVLRELNAR